MPVYSNTRCSARVHRERMHVRRARSASSCASTCARRDACRKKRCVDATTRANFSHATCRYARNRCGRRVRIGVLNVSIDAADLQVEHLRCAPREVAAIAMANSACRYRKSRAAHPMREVLTIGSTHRCVRALESAKGIDACGVRVDACDICTGA